MHTTLNRIKSFHSCVIEWNEFLGNLKKVSADDKPLPFSVIWETLGMEDAIWCIRTLFAEDLPKIALFSVDMAEFFLPAFEKEYPKDDRPRKCIEAAKLFVDGKINKEKLKAVRVDAYRVHNEADDNAAVANEAHNVDAAAANAAADAAAYAANAVHAADADVADYADVADSLTCSVYNYVRGADAAARAAEIEKLFLKHFG